MHLHAVQLVRESLCACHWGVIIIVNTPDLETTTAPQPLTLFEVRNLMFVGVCLVKCSKRWRNALEVQKLCILLLCKNVIVLCKGIRMKVKLLGTTDIRLPVDLTKGLCILLA